MTGMVPTVTSVWRRGKAFAMASENDARIDEIEVEDGYGAEAVISNGVGVRWTDMHESLKELACSAFRKLSIDPYAWANQ